VSLACEAFPRDTVDLWAARWIGYNSNSNFHDDPVEDKVEPGEAQVAGRTVQLNALVEQLNQVQRQIDLAPFRQDMDDLEQLRFSGHNTKTTSSVNRNEIEKISRKWMPNSDTIEIQRSVNEREVNERRVALRLPKFNEWIYFSSRVALTSNDSVASIAAIPDDIAVPAAFQRFYDSANHTTYCINQLIGIGDISHLLDEYIKWVKPLIQRVSHAFEALKSELLANPTLEDLNHDLGMLIISNIVTSPLPEEGRKALDVALSSDPSIEPTEQKEIEVSPSELPQADATNVTTDCEGEPNTSRTVAKTKRGGSRFMPHSVSLREIPANDRSKKIGISQAAKLFFPDADDDKTARSYLLAACQSDRVKFHAFNRQTIIFDMNALLTKTSREVIDKLRPNAHKDAAS